MSTACCLMCSRFMRHRIQRTCTDLPGLESVWEGDNTRDREDLTSRSCMEDVTTIREMSMSNSIASLGERHHDAHVNGSVRLVILRPLYDRGELTSLVEHDDM